MLAHLSCHAPAACRGARHVTAIADMLPAAWLIGAHIIGAENDAVLFRDEGLSVLPHPIGQCLLFNHVAVEREGLARPYRRIDDGEDGTFVSFARRPDQHGGYCITETKAASWCARESAPKQQNSTRFTEASSLRA